MIHGKISRHARLVIRMVPAALADDCGFVETIPQVFDLGRVVAVAGLNRAFVTGSELAAFRHRMSLGLVDFAPGDIEYFVSLRPPLTDPAALCAGCRPAVRIVFVEILFHLLAPLLGYGVIALDPALGAVDFIDDEPEEQRPAVSPSGDHVSVQLLLVFPCLFASEEIFCAADEAVGIVSVPCVSTAPDGHRNIGMEPDVPTDLDVTLLAPFEELVHPAAAVLVVASQAGSHRFKRGREKADEIRSPLFQIIESIFSYSAHIEQFVAVVIPHPHAVKRRPVVIPEVTLVRSDLYESVMRRILRVERAGLTLCRALCIGDFDQVTPRAFLGRGEPHHPEAGPACRIIKSPDIPCLTRGRSELGDKIDLVRVEGIIILSIQIDPQLKFFVKADLPRIRPYPQNRRRFSRYDTYHHQTNQSCHHERLYYH